MPSETYLKPRNTWKNIELLQEKKINIFIKINDIAH